MLELRDVSLIYNPGSPAEVVALTDVSLTIPSGQFVTIVGSNGAGKSSLFQVVSGAVRPTAGHVYLNDRDVTRYPDHRRARWIARVFDNPLAGTAPGLSIEENLALAMARGRSRRLRRAVTKRAREAMRERLAILELGLEDRLSDQVALLSAGQRQSLTMIMAGMTEPQVLMLDEHLAALDPETGRRVLDLTLRLAEELSCTTVMITHNMEHAIEAGDRLLVMSRGRVVADFSGAAKAELTRQALIEHLSQVGDGVSDRIALATLEMQDKGLSHAG